MLIEFTVPVRVVVDVEDDTTVRPKYSSWSVSDLARAMVEGNIVNVDLEIKVEQALRNCLKTAGGINIYLRLGA